MVCNAADCNSHFLLRISVMGGSKCLLILKYTQLKRAGTNKEEMKDREAKQPHEDC